MNASDDEPRAALGTTPFEYRAPATGCHPGAKAVGSYPLDAAGLIGALHDPKTFLKNSDMAGVGRSARLRRDHNDVNSMGLWITFCRGYRLPILSVPDTQQ